MFKTAPTLAIEDVIYIHSLSIILVLNVIRGEFPTLLNQFSIWGTMNLVVMVAGLCELTRKPTARSISDRLGGVSHDSLTRFLKSTTWNAATIMIALFNFAQVQCSGTPAPSWLVLDDVIIPKAYAKKIAGAYWDWDYVHHQHTFCIRLVVLMWTNGVFHVPVAFALWHKKDSAWLAEQNRRYHTKNVLARCLIYKVIRRGLTADYITFDSWYTSKENLNLVQRLGWTYYAAVKNSRKFNRDKQSLACKAWASSYTTRQYNYYRNRAFRAKSIVGYLNGANHDQQLTIVPKYRKKAYFSQIKMLADESVPKKIKKKVKRDPNLYIVTNNLTATTCGTIDAYRSRWQIEVMFRELKQNLGLGACQHRTLEAVNRHFALCFLAYLCLQLMRRKRLARLATHEIESLTIGDVKKHLKEQYFIAPNATPLSNQTQRTERKPISRALLTELMADSNPLVISLTPKSFTQDLENKGFQ